MGIAKVTNYVTLTNPLVPSDVKLVKVTKVNYDRTLNTVTVSKWGDDIWELLHDAYNDGKTYFGFGLYDFPVAFYSPYYELGANMHGINIPTHSLESYTLGRYDVPNFVGMGLYIGVDTTGERPEYVFISKPAFVINNEAFPIPDERVPIMLDLNRTSGYYENNLLMPRTPINRRRYVDYYFRDYPNYTDEGVPTEVNGFPYGPDDSGESRPTDGGDMVDDSEPIGVDEIRTLFAGNLFRVYKLNTTGLSELSNFLLSPEFLDNIKKLFNDPMDYLISLTAMPTAAFTGINSSVKIGNVNTNISCTQLSNFFVDVDCGSIAIPQYFNAYLDYSPYTSISVYLIGCGVVPLNVDMFVGGHIYLKYRVDALTGQCLAFISNDNGLVSTHSGNLAYHIPLRSKDYSEMFSGVMTMTGGVIGGDYASASAGFMQTEKGIFKPHIVQGGAFSGNTSIMCNKKPYIIIERPTISIPKNYAHNIGFNSQIYSVLSRLHGFTKVKEIHLDNVIATREEKAELERLLKNGVVLP